MTADEIKSFYQKLNDTLNQPNWAELLRDFAVDEADAREIEGFIQEHEVFRAAFPDYHATIVEMLVEGNRMAVHNRIRATHAGDFPFGELKGIPPSGKTLEWDEVNFLTFDDKKSPIHG